MDQKSQDFAARAQDILASAPRVQPQSGQSGQSGQSDRSNQSGQSRQSTDAEIDRKIDDLVDKMGKKFSRDEVENFVKLGKKVAAKPVLSLIISTLKEHMSEMQLRPLEKKIRKTMPYNYCIPAQLTFAELPGYRLNIQLSIVPRNYKTDISIPDVKYVPELLHQYDFLRKTAVAYWVEWARMYPGLYQKIITVLKDIDLSEPHVDDANPTTIYFCPEAKSRIGIFCYYTDEAGRPMIKKKTTPSLDQLAEDESSTQ